MSAKTRAKKSKRAARIQRQREQGRDPVARLEFKRAFENDPELVSEMIARLSALAHTYPHLIDMSDEETDAWAREKGYADLSDLLSSMTPV